MIAGPRSDIGKVGSCRQSRRGTRSGRQTRAADRRRPASRRRSLLLRKTSRSGPARRDERRGPIENAIRRQVLPNLDLLTRGAISASPSEILMSDRLGRVIERLAPLYDVVIVDTPPVLAATDSSVIGMHAGTTLLVLPSRPTFRDRASRVDETASGRRCERQRNRADRRTAAVCCSWNVLIVREREGLNI